MAVVAFVRAEPDVVGGPAGSAGSSVADSRLRLYGRMMKFCFLFVLTLWVVLQGGCLLSLFLHFRSGIIVGTIHGSLAFKFWPAIDYFVPTHALAQEFSPMDYPLDVSLAVAAILVAASVPFCGALLFLAQLFNCYSRGEVFTRRNTIVARRIGHCIMATGYSPLLLGPVAHMIGVLEPVTGVTDGMITFFFMGLILLSVSHVMTIGQRLKQDQEEIL